MASASGDVPQPFAVGVPLLHSARSDTAAGVPSEQGKRQFTAEACRSGQGQRDNIDLVKIICCLVRSALSSLSASLLILMVYLPDHSAAASVSAGSGAARRTPPPARKILWKNREIDRNGKMQYAYG